MSLEKLMENINWMPRWISVSDLLVLTESPPSLLGIDKLLENINWMPRWISVSDLLVLTESHPGMLGILIGSL